VTTKIAMLRAHGEEVEVKDIKKIGLPNAI
jgi:hypothetical protein